MTPDNTTREPMDEGQPRETPIADLRRNTLAHYEKVSLAAHEWHSIIPQAINRYFDERERLAALPPTRPAATSEPLTGHASAEPVRTIEQLTHDIEAFGAGAGAAEPESAEQLAWIEKAKAARATLMVTVESLRSAPLPSGEPTSEAVAWRSRIICLDEIIAIVEREYTGYESDVERIKDALSSLREVALRSAAFAHPLPSDAPSGKWRKRVDVRDALNAIIESAGHPQFEHALPEALHNLCDLVAASPPQDAPRRAEVEAASRDAIYDGIRYFGKVVCAIARVQPTWTLTTVMNDPEARRCADDLLALCATPAAPVDLSAVEAAIDEFEREARRLYYRDGALYDEKAEEAARRALLSLYRTALSLVTAKEAGELNDPAIDRAVDAWFMGEGTSTPEFRSRMRAAIAALQPTTPSPEDRK